MTLERKSQAMLFLSLQRANTGLASAWAAQLTSRSIHHRVA